jgi:type IV secretory pathway ATPase VirB11/archaellum biosynthesis ATPase
VNAQTLRDKIAAVRNFDVVIDDQKIEEVIIDIVNSKVIIVPERKADPIKKSDPALSALDALIKERKGGDKDDSKGTN